MNRGGFTLLLVLLAVVALELLTLSSLALSTHEQVVASTQLRTVRARRQADAALRRLIAAWPSLLDSTAVGQRRIVRDSAGMKLEIERYGWGMLELIATVQAGTHAQQRSMLLRSFDAARAFQEMNDALITAGPLELSGTTIVIDDAGGCTLPFEAERAARRLTVARPEFAGYVDAVVDSTYAVAPAGYALGGVRWLEVAGIADTVINGSIVLSDSTEGGRAQLLFAPGDLTIMGGRGRGLLMVQGNLRIHAAEFAGIVLVGGTLDADQAQIAGSVRIQGRAQSRIVDSQLAYQRCVTARGMLEAAATRLLIRGGRRLLPTF